MAEGLSLPRSFEGTSVAIFGIVDPTPAGGQGPAAAFTLDDQEPVNFVAPATSSILSGHCFYTSPPLTYGQHTIKVTATQVSSDLKFWFDYLIYNTEVLTASNPSSSVYVSAIPTSIIAIPFMLLRS